MQVEFQTTTEDYYKVLKLYFFKRNAAKRLILLAIIAIWLGFFRQVEKPFIISMFILQALSAAIVLIILFLLLPYLVAKIRLKRFIKSNFYSSAKTLVIDETGVRMISDIENNFWRWETLNKAEFLDDYLFISLFTNKYYVVPLSYFSNINEAINFLGIIKNNIQKVRGNSRQRKIRNLYYWGLIGFIPNFGVIAGIVILIKGFQFNKIKLMLVGIADILFTIFFWMVLSPLIFSNAAGFKEISQKQLNSVVKNIEFYNLQHGQYPDSLQQLLKDDNFAPIYDLSQAGKINMKTVLFNYRKVKDKYILFSSGLDGIPNTSDDLYPQIKIDSNKIGLINPK
ncbi:MAG TPA: hypothetical protein VKR53_12235 [Puia sp.]|nr:hypothetical protein [Puia sp.]